MITLEDLRRIKGNEDGIPWSLKIRSNDRGVTLYMHIDILTGGYTFVESDCSERSRISNTHYTPNDNQKPLSSIEDVIETCYFVTGHKLTLQ